MKERELFRLQEKVVNPVTVCLLLVLGLSVVGLRTWLWQEMGWTISHWTLLFVPMLLIVFWSVLPARSLPQWLTAAAFPIYLMHTLLWALFCKSFVLSGCMVPQFMKVETLGDWWVKWLVGFGGPLIISLAARQFLPRTSRVLFGGR